MVSSRQTHAARGTFRPAVDQSSMFIMGPLILFTLSDLILVLVGEAVKTHLIWNFRYADMIELALIAPLCLVSFVWWEGQFVSRDAPKWLRWAFLVLAFLYLYGYGMRVASNSVNTFSTEIHHYKSLIPADTYALIYFLDETLAHYILFVARFGIFACVLLLDLFSGPAGDPAPFPAYKWALALGCLYGIWQSIVFIEGQKAFLLPILAIGLSLLWYMQWRKQGGKLADFARSRLMTAFVAGLIPCIFLGMLAYFLIFGGFPEPSTLG